MLKKKKPKAYLLWPSLIPNDNIESKSQCILMKKTVLHFQILMLEVVFPSGECVLSHCKSVSFKPVYGFSVLGEEKGLPHQR